ncbi:MAG: hypothetical protein IJG32_05065 [Selenomonadaceae bacterium]|nr:hypothetical protein [Selenomonadaceae bacterium]MBQ4404706.1 hypothetical protein [Selenomonadaceae bacterium]MBQ7494107.1 hypothetical protein [Selenomonadaceae bacterium]
MLTNELYTPPAPVPRRKVNRTEKNSDDPFYSEENLARIKKSIEQFERGQVVEKTFDELRKLVYG